MLFSYIKVTLRNLLRYKAFSIINILGLALGMACCMLIFLFVRDELSFDQHFSKIDRMYRVTYHATNSFDFARVPPPVSPGMADYFSEVELSSRAYMRSIGVNRPLEGSEEASEILEEDNVFFVDSTFTSIFDLEFVNSFIFNFES